jgi:NAD(P)-dependent dehydrogenase (short-subunit alcohol dehydrogenase family)
MAREFDGQTVLVTGGATGLGLAIARAFGARGARIALNDLGQERVDRACAALLGERTTCGGYPADVRDATAVGEMFAAVASDFAVPDIVIANAGIYPNTPFLELPETEWDRVIDTNVKGTFLVCQAAARAMRDANRSGHLVVLSSGAARRAFWGWSHYCTSKAAVLMLASAMALELGTHGIRVNAVLPGYIDVEEGGAHLSEGYREAARTMIPLGRPGTPEDVANAILLLSSPLASYISGAAIAVDGASGTGPMDVRPVDAPPV